MNNYTPTPDFYKDYIAHFGILGQKWGKKNGPPYPLGAGDHSAAEKKAGYTKSKEGKRNTKLYSDGGSGSSSQRKKDYGDLKKKPVNEMTDQEFNKFLKEIDDKELRELARNERNKNKPQKQWNEMSKAEQDELVKKELEAETDYAIKREKELNNKAIEIKKFKKQLDKNPEAKSQKIIDDINNNSEYKEALNKYSELSKKYSQEFNNKLKDPKVIKKAEEDYKKTRGTNKVDKKDPIYDYVLRNIAAGDYEDDPRYDKKVIAEATKAFKKDYGKDADPLINKYWDYYIDDAASKLNWKPKRVKSETEKAFNKAVDNLIEVQNKVVNDYLGSYANQNIGKSTRTYSDVVITMMLDDRTKKK